MVDTEETFRSALAQQILLPSGNTLVAALLMNRLIECSETEMLALKSCDRFAALRDQAATVMRRSPQLAGHEEEVLGCLHRLAETGLLVSRERLVALCEAATGVESRPPTVSWLAIPTSGVAGSALRALVSYIDAAKTFGRTYSFLVADDSRSIKQNRATINSLLRLTRKLSAPIFYAGVQEKITFSKHLAEYVPCSVINSALFGFDDGAITTGANRNAILLHTVGATFLSVDDDTICRTGHLAARNGSLKLSIRGHEDPQEIRLFPDRKSAIKSLIWEQEDFVRCHEQVLGRKLARILADRAISRPPSMDAMCNHMLRMIMAGVGDVVLTFNGAVGDSGWHAGASVLGNPRWRASLGSSSEIAYSNLRGREVVRQSRSYSIGHGHPAGQAMFVGFDNRDILPPFFPEYRNQDGIYGFTVDLCVKDACTAHVPIVLQHFPEVERHYSTGDVGKLRVCDWVLACCSSWSPGPGMKSPQRIRSLGVHLQTLGELPQDEFKGFMAPIFFQRLGSVLGRGRQLLLSYGNQPELWASELSADLGLFRSAALDPDYLAAFDMPARCEWAAPMQPIQKIVRAFGEILLWWPEIVEATRKLRNKGITLGRALRDP